MWKAACLVPGVTSMKGKFGKIVPLARVVVVGEEETPASDCVGEVFQPD